MTPDKYDEMAERIVQSAGNDLDAMVDLISATLRSAVEQDRANHNNRVSEVVKAIRAQALEEAAKVVRAEFFNVLSENVSAEERLALKILDLKEPK